MIVAVGELGTALKTLSKRSECVGNRTINLKKQNYSIVKIDQNTEKIPGHLRRLSVTQTSVKDQQLRLV